MTGPVRIDQAIAPAGFIRSAAAYTLFVTHEGIYAIATGPGWRLRSRGHYRGPPRLMVERVRRVEVGLDPGDLAREVATRVGSAFVSAADIADVVLGRRRFDGLPDLRFTDGARRYRFQFDTGRGDEIQEFVQALSSLPKSARAETADGTNGGGHVLYDGKVFRTVALPSPCWGATPHIALVGGRIFVQYLAPTGVQHGEATIVYRSTYDEHCDIAYGRADMSQLCRRLVQAAWGTSPSPVDDGPGAAQADVVRAESIDTVQQALELCVARRENAEQDLGRGGSAEQQGRLDHIHDLELEQATFELALRLLR